MNDFWDATLGKLLLAAALLWSGVALVVYWPAPLPDELTAERFEKEKSEPVRVVLEPEILLPEERENWFPPGTGADYLRGRIVFVPEKKVAPFRPVNLDLPKTTVPPLPRLLPDPGPSLEGAAGLPRWGKALPPLIAPKKKPKKSSGRAVRRRRGR